MMQIKKALATIVDSIIIDLGTGSDRSIKHLLGIVNCHPLKWAVSCSQCLMNYGSSIRGYSPLKCGGFPSPGFIDKLSGNRNSPHLSFLNLSI